MTVLLTEPFNNFTSAPWTTTASASIVAGGTAGTCCQIVGSTIGATYVIPTANQLSRIKLSFDWKCASSNTITRPILTLHAPNATNLVTLHWNTDGTLKVLLGGTTGSLIATSAALGLVANTFYRLVLDVQIGDAPNGSVSLSVNGANRINATGVDTFPGPLPNQNIGDIGLFGGGTGVNHFFDELLLEDAGTPGEARVAQAGLHVTTPGTSGAAESRVARVSSRALIKLLPQEGQVAQVNLRDLNVLKGEAQVSQTVLRILTTPGGPPEPEAGKWWVQDVHWGGIVITATYLGIQMWWDNQFSFPAVTDSPHLTSAAGGVISGDSWTDSFDTGHSEWDLDPAMQPTADIPIAFIADLAGSFWYGTEAYTEWESSGNTLINSLTRIDETIGDGQFLETVVTNMWQPAPADPIFLPNPDANLRGRVYLITHYDSVTNPAGRWARLSWDNWTGGVTPPVRQALSVNTSNGGFVRPYGHPIDGSGDYVFRFEARADGHNVVFLNGTQVLDDPPA